MKRKLFVLVFSTFSFLLLGAGLNDNEEEANCVDESSVLEEEVCEEEYFMPGATQDQLIFKVTGIPSATGPGSVVCNGFNSGQVKFKVGVTTYTAIIGAPVTVNLPASTTLGSSVTVTGLVGTFQCNNTSGPGGDGAIIAACSGFLNSTGTNFIVEAGDKASHTFNTPTSSGCGNAPGFASLNSCTVIELRLEMSYKRKKLSIPAAPNGDFACGDSPLTLTAAAVKPSLGDRYKWEYSNDNGLSFTEFARTNSASIDVKNSQVGGNPGKVLIRVNDLTCTHNRTSDPQIIEFFPDFGFKNESSIFVLPTCDADALSLRFERNGTEAGKSINYSVIILADNPVPLSECGAFGTECEQVGSLYYKRSGSFNYLLNGSGTDIINTSTLTTAGITAPPFKTGKRYFLKADLVGTNACFFQTSMKVDEIVPMSVSMATVGNTTFCNENTGQISGVFSKKIGEDPSFTIKRDNSVLPESLIGTVSTIAEEKNYNMHISGNNFMFTSRNSGKFEFSFQDGCMVATSAKTSSDATSITLTKAAPLVVTEVSPDIACPGDTSGKVTVTVSGGIGAKTVKIGGEDATMEGVNFVRDNLGPGTYAIVVSDAGSCKPDYTPTSNAEISRPLSFSPPALPAINVCDGTARVTLAALQMGWTWTTIPANATFVSGTTTQVYDLSGISGTQTYTWKAGATGCSLATKEVSQSITITNYNVAANAGTDQFIRYSTNNTNTATLAATAAGANRTGTWTVLSGGTAKVTSANTANSGVTALDVGNNQFKWEVKLNAAIVTELATDACRTDDDQVNVYYSDLRFDKQDPINEKCPNDGTITVSAAGGNSANNPYLLTAGARRYQFTLRRTSARNTAIATEYGVDDAADVVFTGLSNGDYVVRVEDRDPNEASLTDVFTGTLTVGNTPALAFNIGSGDIKSSFCKDGSITLKATGGKGPYTYRIKPSGAPDTEYTTVLVTATGLDVGTYTIEVKDTNLTACNTRTGNFVVGDDLRAFTLTPSFSGSQGSQSNVGAMMNETNYFVCEPTDNVGVSYALTLPTSSQDVVVKIYNLANPTLVLQAETNTSNVTSQSLGSRGVGSYRVVAEYVNGCGQQEFLFNVVPVKPTFSSFIVSSINADGFGVSCIDGDDGQIRVRLNKNESSSYAVTLSGNGFTGVVNSAPIPVDGGTKLEYRFPDLSRKNAGVVTNYTFSVSRSFDGSNVCTYAPADLGVATASRTIQITEPTAIEIKDGDGSSTPRSSYAINCYGDGITVNFTALGGVRNYKTIQLKSRTTSVFDIVEQSISNSPTGLITFNNVTAGTGLSKDYQILVTDKYDCTEIHNFTVTQPTEQTITQVGTSGPPDCIGGDNGSFTVTGANGTPNAAGYKFRIVSAAGVNSESTTNDNLAFGTYLDGSSFGITDPDPNVFRNNATFTRPAGSYTVEITDNVTGCSVQQANFTISANPNPFEIDQINITRLASCDEVNDGRIEVVTDFGIAPYTYEIANKNTPTVIIETISGNNATEEFMNLNGDPTEIEYIVFVTDGNGCTVSATNLSPGIITPVSVSQEGVSVSPFCNIADGLDNTGSFTVEGFGGRGNYTFSLTGLDADYISGTAGKFTFTGLTPGNYTVYIKDGASCPNTTSVTINPAPAIIINTTINLDASRDNTINYILCPGEETSVTVSGTNGNYPMDFKITGAREDNSPFDSGIQTAAAEGAPLTFNNIPAGTFTITAADAQSCGSTSNFVLRTAQRPIVSVLPTVLVTQNSTDYHVSCNDGSDGVLTFNVSMLSEFGDFTIELFANGVSTGPGIKIPVDTDLEFTSLKASNGGAIINYTYTVKNDLIPQCLWEYNTPINLTEPEVLEITDELSTPAKTNGFEIDCFGNTIGYQIDFDGGIYPFQLILRDDNDFPIDSKTINEGDAKTHTFTNISEGTYYIEIQDFFNATCEINTMNFTLDAPPILVPSVDNVNPPTCLAGSDGVVEISATGGNPFAGGAYLYEIENFTLNAPFNLDGENCTSFSTAQISNATATFNLPAGTYDFKVTDQNDCFKDQALMTIVVPKPATPLRIVSVTPKEPACFGGNDGELRVVATDGTPINGNEYRFTLAGGDLTTPRILQGVGEVTFTGLFSSVDVGKYQVSVEDANACCLVDDVNYIDEIEITQPVVIELNLVAAETSQPDCFEGTIGSILTIQAAGGQAPYVFSTDGINFATSALGDKFQLMELPGGADYTIFVRDNRFNPAQPVCTISETFYLPDGPKLNITTDESAVSCFGGNDGASIAFVELTGSLQGFNTNSTLDEAAFTYEWYDLLEGVVVSNDKDLVSAKAGTYRLTVERIGITCSQFKIVTINQPEKPLAIQSLDTSNETCGGRNDGSVFIELSGGNPLANQSLEYSLNSSGFLSLPIDNTIRNLSEGNYDITIRNATSCSAISSFSIGTNQLIVTPLVTTEITCFGQETAVVTLNVSMRFEEHSLPANLEYSKDNIDFQTSNVFTELAAGNHQFYVRDVSNVICGGISEVLKISQPNEILLEVTLESKSHCGKADGVAKTTVTNGVNPNVVWLDDMGSVTMPNALIAGNYTVRAIDDNGCSSVIANFTMEEEPALTVSAMVTEHTYCSLPMGKANALIENGVAPFTLTWKNGTDIKTGINVEALLNGEYTLTVTDQVGCSAETKVNINNQLPFTIEVTEIINTACGADLGMITVEAKDGFAPYTYFWPALNVSENTVSNLTNGAYQVVVTDAKGCEVSRVINILPEGDAITIETNLTLPVCESATGVIEVINVTGGDAPYTYIWKDKDLQLISGNTSRQENLNVGTYFVEVVDNMGCRYPQPSIELISDVSKEPTLSVSGITQSFCDKQNGDFQFVILQGQAPFTVRLTDDKNDLVEEKIITSSSDQFENIGAGSYTIQLTDAYNCDFTTGFVMEDSETPFLSISNIKSATPAIAVGGFEVSLSVNPGDTYTYKVVDKDDVTANFTSSPITGLFSGFYEVTAINSFCESNTLFVEVPSNTPLSVVETLVRPTCDVAIDGSVSLEVSGGIEPYTYAWTGRDDTNNFVENLGADTYTITITDAIGDEFIHVSTLVAKAPLIVASSIISQPSCFEKCDGSIALNLNGGSSSYQVTWSNGMTGSSIADLCTGTYLATITDELNSTCFITHEVILTEPTEVTLAVQSFVLPTCYQGADGSLTLEVAGGSGLYEITWPEIGTTGLTASGLSANTYQVNVFDEIGKCDNIFEVTLADQLQIMVTDTIITPPSCFGANDGKIEIVLANTTNALVMWSNGDQGNISDQLAAGTHSFDLLDGNGCAFTASFEILDPKPLEITSQNAVSVSCFEGFDGAISIDVTGGTNTYDIFWSLNGTSQPGLTSNFNPTDLLAGTYEYTIRDSNGCEIIDEIIVGSPDELVFDKFEVIPAICNGEENGTLEVIVSGGTGTYTYILNGNAIELPIRDLIAGDYQLIVSDGNNCDLIRNFIVGEPSDLIVERFEIADVLCDGGTDGSITVHPFGGNGEYTYLWSNGATSSTVENLAIGDYEVTISDVLGCEIVANYTVDSPNKISLVNVVSQNPTCFEGDDGRISVEAIGGAAPYKYEWTNGEASNQASALSAGDYSLKVTDNNGCFRDFDFKLTDPDQVFIRTLTEKSVTLCAGADKRLDAGPEWARYEWFLNDELISTDQMIDADQRGVYQLNAYSAEGCMATDFVNFTIVTNPLEADFVLDNNIFSGDTLVVIDVSWPVPSNILWELPEGVTRLTGDNELFFQELIFSDPGTYQIGLSAFDDGCSDFTLKEFFVQDRSSRPAGLLAGRELKEDESIIEEAIISPNPSDGKFELVVKLDRKAPVEVLIYGYDRNIVLENLNGEGRLTYGFDIDMGNVVSGVYVMVIRSGESTKVKKIVIR